MLVEQMQHEVNDVQYLPDVNGQVAYMYCLYVLLICIAYMYCLYVLLICIAYMYCLHVSVCLYVLLI
jgi:hypothetical protein